MKNMVVDAGGVIVVDTKKDNVILDMSFDVENHMGEEERLHIEDVYGYLPSSLEEMNAMLSPSKTKSNVKDDYKKSKYANEIKQARIFARDNELSKLTGTTKQLWWAEPLRMNEL